MNFFSVKGKVLEKLKKLPDCRDNDNLLIATLIEEMEGETLEKLSAKSLLHNLKKGDYGSLE